MRILEWVAMPSPRESQPRSPALQVDSLPSEPPGKPSKCGRQNAGSTPWLQLGPRALWPLCSPRVFLTSPGSSAPGAHLPGGSGCEEPACSAGDPALIPGSGGAPGGGHGNPLQCSCLEIPVDRGAWWATVHGVAKSQTRLSDSHFH